MTTPAHAQGAPAALPTAEVRRVAADWVTRVDAGLTREEQQIFQDWLSADPRHAEAFDQFTEAWSVFDRVQEAGAASTILDRLEARRKTRQRQRRTAVLTAATLAVAAGLAWVSLRPAGAGDAAAPGPATPVVALAEDPVRKLPDGSIVELNTGAEIVVQYSADARRVRLLQGEAYFRVEKDPARPFFVEAHGVEVRAVGTAFTVNMKQSAIEVLVREGAVDVNRSAEKPAGDPRFHRLVPTAVRVEAGSKVIVPISAAVLTPATKVAEQPAAVEPIAPPRPEPVTEEQMNEHLAWRIPRIEFEGISLAEAVRVMNRHNRLQLRLEDERLGALRLSGTIRSDNPEGFVRVLERSLDLEVVTVGDHELLLRRAR